MAFDGIAGNSRIKQILKLALLKGRVPNSLLFCGPEGIGKRRTALTLAKALNCLRLKDDSCDACVPCRAIDRDFGLAGDGGEVERGRFPDVMEIAPEKNTVRIDQIRLLKQMAYLKPMSGRRRVFIVDEAEKMNEEAENSLLKVLEEPPPHAHIVLVTSSPFLLLPTIRSRCQVLGFAAINQDEIRKRLIAGGYTEKQARVLSLFVGGNMGRALDLDWEAVRKLKSEAWDLFSGMLSGSRTSDFLGRFGRVPRALQEELTDFLEVFLSFARDLILLQSRGDVGLLLNPDYQSELSEAAETTTARQSLALIADLDFVLSSLGGNFNKSLLVTKFVSNFGELTHV